MRYHTTIRYVVRTPDGLLVVGFSYPPGGKEPDNLQLLTVPRYAQVSTSCWAMLGNERPYWWRVRKSAEAVAAIIGGIVEEATV